MLTSRSTSRLGAALIGAIALLALTTGLALAHPESEGDHPGGCVVTAEPGSIPVGGQFTVEGNFGGASIWVLPGADATVPEDATPSATTPAGESFSVVFTATGDPGDLTIFAAIEGSECGDTDHVTVTATLPNTATTDADDRAALAGLLLLTAAFLAVRRNEVSRRSVARPDSLPVSGPGPTA
jgi:hypothetical protein